MTSNFGANLEVATFIVDQIMSKMILFSINVFHTIIVQMPYSLDPDAVSGLPTVLVIQDF